MRIKVAEIAFVYLANPSKVMILVHDGRKFCVKIVVIETESKAFPSKARR
jgi:hypothetical protein